MKLSEQDRTQATKIYWAYLTDSHPLQNTISCLKLVQKEYVKELDRR